MGDAIDPTSDPDGLGRTGTSIPKALVGWLLVLLVLAGLAMLFWPKIATLMRHNEQSNAAGNQAGLPLAQTGQAQAGQSGTIFHPRPAPKSYPLCTATRTD